MKVIHKGNAVSKGIGIGRAYIYKPYIPHIREEFISDSDIDKELETYEKVKHQAQKEISNIQKFLEENDDDKSKIFDAHLEILNDILIAEEMNKPIKGVLITRYSGKRYEMSISNIKEMLEVPILGIIPEEDSIKESQYVPEYFL